jgi:bacillithiol system protein YtxJ
MSLFKNIFGDSNKTSNSSIVTWRLLTDLQQLDEIINESTETPVIIFKHSTRCIVSRMALKQFENDFDFSSKVNAYFLDLLENRNISSEIASRFGVVHQSPQLILIKDGKAIYNASHSDIASEDLERFL